MATSLARDARSEAVTARGETVLDGRIAPGASVKVDAPALSGTYLVTEVEHIYDRRGSRTSFVAGSTGPAAWSTCSAPRGPTPAS